MTKETLIIILMVLDTLLMMLIFWFYFKFRKLLELPWEEIRESILRAQELVHNLEKMGSNRQERPYSPDQILAMYKQGLTPREIAKKLGISQGEVELLLKTKGFRLE